MTRSHQLTRDDYLMRLRRIEGQMRGLQRMIDDDADCIEILTQISSAARALQAVGVGLIDEHLRHVIRDSASDLDTDLDASVAPVTRAVEQLLHI